MFHAPYGYRSTGKDRRRALQQRRNGHKGVSCLRFIGRGSGLRREVPSAVVVPDCADAHLDDVGEISVRRRMPAITHELAIRVVHVRQRHLRASGPAADIAGLRGPGRRGWPAPHQRPDDRVHARSGCPHPFCALLRWASLPGGTVRVGPFPSAHSAVIPLTGGHLLHGQLPQEGLDLFCVSLHWR